jgi:hypothetical protein
VHDPAPDPTEENVMRNYLAVFTGSPESFGAWKAMGAEERAQKEQAGLAAWGKWMRDHADALVDGGGPLGKTKRITQAGIADTSNNLGGYTIVRAASQADAAKLFEGHPHFTIFPGDGVEVMEVMDIPKG